MDKLIFLLLMTMVVSCDRRREPDWLPSNGSNITGSSSLVDLVREVAPDRVVVNDELGTRRLIYEKQRVQVILSRQDGQWTLVGGKELDDSKFLTSEEVERRLRS